mmetsp:Transcript_24323/g.56046  ORF Transcript_24323/g.56046 Transcript_24323/m.56046 type:complete len:693 (+) Transcript_24323:3321-5399(+)
MVEAERLGSQRGRVRLELVVKAEELALGVRVEQAEQLVLPLGAMVGEGRLEQGAVDLDKVDRVRDLLALDVRLLLAVLGHVRVVVLERAVGLGVAPNVRLLVHLPDRLVLVPVREVLLELGGGRRHAVHDRDEDLEHVHVVVDDRIERRVLLRLALGRRGGALLIAGSTGRDLEALVLGGEHLAEARHDAHRRDHLLGHHVDHVGEVDHGRAVVDAPVLEDDVDTEEGLRLGLGVAVDRARELLERALDGLAEGQLDVAVSLGDQRAPLALHLGRAVLEVLEHLDHRLLNRLVALGEACLDAVAVGGLLGVELGLVVDRVLVDLEEEQVGHPAAGARDRLLARLEPLDNAVGLGAVAAAVLDIELHDTLGRPSELGQALVDPLVEPTDVVREKAALLRREVDQNVVVRAHHEHHVLAHHAQLLALVTEVVRDVRDRELALELLPVVDLGEEGEQVLVEVALEQRVLRLGATGRIVGRGGAAHERRVEARLEVGRVERLELLVPRVVPVGHVVVQHLIQRVVRLLRHLGLPRSHEVLGVLQQVARLLHHRGERTRPERRARELRLVGPEAHVALVELVARVANRLLEKDVHVGRLLLDALPDGVPLGEGVEDLEQRHAVRDVRDAVERGVDHVLVHDLVVFDHVLKVVVVIMPLGGLHVEDLIVVALDLAQALDLRLEVRLDFEQGLGDLLPA